MIIKKRYLSWFVILITVAISAVAQDRPAADVRDAKENDLIGVLQMEFVDWDKRRPAKQIFAEIRERTADMAGVIIEVREQEHGPPVGKPVQLQLSSQYPQMLEPAIVKLRQMMDEVGGFVDVEDSRPLPGIEWQIEVDRVQAARFGAVVERQAVVLRRLSRRTGRGRARGDGTGHSAMIGERSPAHEGAAGRMGRGPACP